MEKSIFIDPGSKIIITAQEDYLPMRLDVYLTKHFPAYSRNFFQDIINKKNVLINNIITTKHSHLVRLNNTIEITFPAQSLAPLVSLTDSNLEIKLIYEHEHFLIIFKPPYLVVHPPSHIYTHTTLVDWLIAHFPELKEVGPAERPGIVHRLDKDTSGIMIIPRNNYAYTIFTALFKNRQIEKTYLAVVQGQPPASGSIEFSITRDTLHKHKMTHKQMSGKEAFTYYRVKEYFLSAALVEVHPLTGRTHQIRVHFSAIGHPIINDIVYGCSSPLISRQALHAYRLEFEFLGHWYTFTEDMPSDMSTLIESLRLESKF